MRAYRSGSRDGDWHVCIECKKYFQATTYPKSGKCWDCHDKRVNTLPVKRERSVARG